MKKLTSYTRIILILYCFAFLSLSWLQAAQTTNWDQQYQNIINTLPPGVSINKDGEVRIRQNLAVSALFKLIADLASLKANIDKAYDTALQQGYYDLAYRYKALREKICTQRDDFIAKLHRGLFNFFSSTRRNSQKKRNEFFTYLLAKEGHIAHLSQKVQSLLFGEDFDIYRLFAVDLQLSMIQKLCDRLPPHTRATNVATRVNSITQSSHKLERITQYCEELNELKNVYATLVHALAHAQTPADKLKYVLMPFLEKYKQLRQPIKFTSPPFVISQFRNNVLDAYDQFARGSIVTDHHLHEILVANGIDITNTTTQNWKAINKDSVAGYLQNYQDIDSYKKNIADLTQVVTNSQLSARDKFEALKAFIDSDVYNKVTKISTIYVDSEDKEQDLTHMVRYVQDAHNQYDTLNKIIIAHTLFKSQKVHDLHELRGFITRKLDQEDNARANKGLVDDLVEGDITLANAFSDLTWGRKIQLFEQVEKQERRLVKECAAFAADVDKDIKNQADQNIKRLSQKRAMILSQIHSHAGMHSQFLNHYLPEELRRSGEYSYQDIAKHTEKVLVNLENEFAKIQTLSQEQKVAFIQDTDRFNVLFVATNLLSGQQKQRIQSITTSLTQKSQRDSLLVQWDDPSRYDDLDQTTLRNDRYTKLGTAKNLGIGVFAAASMMAVAVALHRSGRLPLSWYKAYYKMRGRVQKINDQGREQLIASLISLWQLPLLAQERNRRTQLLLIPFGKDIASSVFKEAKQRFASLKAKQREIGEQKVE